ncbi:MAG: hypothetical protein GXO35_07990 [Gammaproteobacteria bacterium]|nr:hypothetical protein [Gammaproteobacteria bacterium]
MSNEEFALGAKEVQETILVLNLSVAQIDLSITEGDNSVNTLIDSFTFMSQHISQIQASSQLIADMAGETEGVHEQQNLLVSEAGELSNKMQQAVIAFQFYDKLSQRLGHVSHGLSGLAEIVSHEMRVKDQDEWESFKSSVRKGTTMREEEELFELIFDLKMPINEAIEIMKGRMRDRMHQEEEAEEDIELF